MQNAYVPAAVMFSLAATTAPLLRRITMLAPLPVTFIAERLTLISWYLPLATEIADDCIANAVLIEEDIFIAHS